MESIARAHLPGPIARVLAPALLSSEDPATVARTARAVGSLEDPALVYQPRGQY